VGQGTTFTIYLPTSAPLRGETSEAEETGLPRGQGEAILLVEDEPTVLELGKTMLESLGYRVLVATNGREGVEKYKRYHDEIALVLSDMVMPEMGGVELYQVLKEKDPSVKVVVTTGYPLDSGAKDLLSTGIINWIQKPFSIKSLAEVVYKALGKEVKE